MSATGTAAKVKRTMGHIALHYPHPADGPLAARLLTLLGYVETQLLPLPNGTNFYRFVVNDDHHARGDGIIYLSCLPDAVRAVVEASRSALGFGTEAEHPSIADLREAVAQDPEYMFHLGLLVDSLPELERIVADIRGLEASDPAYKGRLKVTVNRPRRGDEEIDALLDASAEFGAVDRYAYGRNGIQVFIETDLLASGPLADSLVLEFDYLFPGKTSHILSVVEL